MLTGLHVLLTYRCPYECAHCFLSCGPASEGTFTLAGLRELFRQAADLPDLDSVYFEGGEPFLYHPLLLAGVRLAREGGYRVGVVTNGYFAETEEDAGLWLEPLAEAGLESLTVSEDSYHGSTDGPGPAARTRAAADALGIGTGTICVPRPGEGEGLLLRGRAARELVGDLPRRPLAALGPCCDEDLAAPGRVHVDSFGHVHVCQGLTMGNWRETPLRELFDGWDAAGDEICGPLLAGGPAALARAFDLPEDPRGYPTACHACSELRAALRERRPDRIAPPGIYGEEPADRA